MKLSFFHAGGLKKAAINRISRILPSRKEEREILFRDQEIGSSHNIRRMLGINNSLLGFRPPQSLRALPDQCNGMCLFIYLLTRNGRSRCDDLLHGRGLWFKSRMAQLRQGKKRIEEASDSFMHASLGSGGYSSVGRAPLLQLGRCDYGNGEEDRNMPLKDSTETKRWAVKNVEEVGWAVGQI
ncbi:hypothetical protein IEQ34_023373 [Dendrobium chrysotoxum]|uniref:Uncharacterized protein n=2 Tax=Dendrobium chrysotoxum TaxID=161865 RepID=A0AAV7FUT2_DENCH|nr:hypothetical protein IEQ34_025720 [Dendrobium chrysotoxum]KAH0446068.1 hypothetical protein IEQ34_025101 [Dendrobium chrysotoxum]KAH0446420.1 hypothetical protein IEQ34_024748 [Dendrobium chrysotoxum]KAH0446710.1 hypothetical protein IEQ34_024461 [Dendrobium chrysotoxum]KAH0446715.1 hypothetical protein IEQ34_024437 [Dendrobium chrysotoxum]